MVKCKILKRRTVKKKTVNGSLAKQCETLLSDPENPKNLSLNIKKYVLCDDNFNYKKLGMVLVKSFKNKILIKQEISIRVSTLSDTINWIAK